MARRADREYPAIFEGEATPPAGMPRRSNAGGLFHHGLLAHAENIRRWSDARRLGPPPNVASRSHVRLTLGRGTAIVGHDRIDELLVVRFVVRSLATQGFDLRDSFTSEHLGVPRNANFTRPLDVRHPTIERADKLAQRCKYAARCGYAALWFLSHQEAPSASKTHERTGAQVFTAKVVLGGALSCFLWSFCFCFFASCCWFFSLSFLPPLSPMLFPFIS